MEKGAASPGDTPQQHAYDLHGVGTNGGFRCMTTLCVGCEKYFPSKYLLDLHVRTHFENPTHVNHGSGRHHCPDNLAAANTIHGHTTHSVHPLGTHDHAGQAVQDPSIVFSANDINDGLKSFHAIAAPGVAYSDNTYGGLGVGFNVEAGFSPYDDVAAPSFTSRAVEDAAGAPYANDINGGIYALSNLGHNGTDYFGQALGLVTAPDIGYDLTAANAVHGYGDHAIQPLETLGQANHAVQDHRLVYSANTTNDGLHSFENDTAPGVTYTDDIYGGVDSRFGNVEVGIFPYGYAAAHGLPHRAVQYSELGSYPDITGSIIAPSNLGLNDANHLGHSFGNVAAPDTAYGQSAYTAGDAALLLQRRNIADNADPTNNVNVSFKPSNNATATGMANSSNDHAKYDTGFGAQSSGASATPTMISSTLSPSTPGSMAGPDGRPRWACTSCVKTFSRPADMERHARKHSGVLQYQCDVAGCKYPGSYRQDKLEQHRRNCH